MRWRAEIVVRQKGDKKSKLSKPQAGIFINNENNLDSTMETRRTINSLRWCAEIVVRPKGDKKSKLSKPQAGIFINNENNLDSTMRTIEIQQ